MITYRQATNQDIESIVALCTEAFLEYPLYKNMLEIYFSDMEKYHKFLKQFMTVYVKSYMKFQPCLIAKIDNKIVAVALLEDKSKRETNAVDYIFSGVIKILKYLPINVIFSYLDLINDTTIAFKNMTKNRWYLSTLAVDKSYQGYSIGSKIINEYVVPYIKEHNGNILTLTTNTELNSKFYIKNGFSNIDKRTLNFKNKTIENWSFQLNF